MSLHRYIAAATAAGLILLANGARAADSDPQVRVNRTEIYLTESVLLELRVPGPAVTDPDLSRIQGCRIRYLGSQDASETRFSIINGVVRHEGFSGRTYSYEVTPATAGRHTLGPIRLNVSGREVELPGPSITVVGTEEQDRVRIEITTTRDTVLVDEPFDVTLTVLIRRLGGNYADADPINPSEPPSLNVPFLEAQPFDGLTGPDIQQMLRSMLVPGNRQGFAINSYTVRADPLDPASLFDLNAFMRDVPARFALPRQPVEREGSAFFAYRTTLSYRPDKEGNYTFGPAVFKGRVVAGVDGAGRAIGPSIFAIGPARTVRVVPPPELGRPSSFTGALGSNMVVDASLDTQSCRVGDPLRLRISIGGSVRLDSIAPPALNLQSNLLEHFTIYDDTVETARTGERREFAYTVRPRSPGTFEFPPVSLSYYDLGARQYRTVSTRPIPIQVSATSELTGDQVIARTNVIGRQAPDSTAALPPVAGMRAPRDGTRTVSLSGGWLTLAVAAAGPSVFSAIALTLALRRFAARRGPIVRRARALDHAIAAAARAARTSATPAHRRAAVYEAMKGFLSDRFDLPASGVTPADARRLLSSGGALPPGAEAFCDVMDRMFELGFSSAPDPTRLDALCEQALAAMHTLRTEQRAAAVRSAPRAVRALALAAALGNWPAVSQAQADAERQFMWDAANTALAQAREPSDYLDAARRYQEMVDRGVLNGVIFYNQGLALLMAGRHADAVRVFLRAERYLGRAPDLSANLRIARARQSGQRLASEPWQRILLFWHYGLPCAWRSLVGAVGFSVVWLSLSARLLGFRRVARVGMALGLAAVVIFGSSAVTSLYQDAHPIRPSFEAPAPAALAGVSAKP